MWDWDEVQFCAALREYDVPLHHPHPPGFPLFVLAAKFVRLFVRDDFHALQSVTFIAACALFPLLFFVARALRFDFATSYAGALLFVFLPDVWFYGGTAFSDITGIAAILTAVGLLLWRDETFLAGAAMLGVAAAIRPQAMLFGVAPFLLAAWRARQRPGRVVIAGVLAATIVVASYAGAAAASSSFTGYRDSVRGVKTWVRSVDAFTNPARPQLLSLAADFFVHPMGGGRIAWVLVALACIALVDRRSWLVVAIFAPFAGFAWLMLDHYSIHRYATAYVALHALLAARGAQVVLRRRALQVAAIALIALRYAWWTAPALATARTTPSPTYAGMQWLRAQRVPIYVHGSLGPFANYFLYDRPVLVLRDLTTLPPAAPPHALAATEGLVVGARATFVRPFGRLYELARQRYFTVSVLPLSNVWQFGDGWYDAEEDPPQMWRWMSARSVTTLPALRAARGRLTLALAAPKHEQADVEVRFNGVLLERFHCTDIAVPRSWSVPSRASNTLVLAASPARRMGNDRRVLSVQLVGLGWE
ncbi:MAG: hypothetical protein JO197_12470 [Acidobacteria bacterium]|nr:hypothetical protein [Acidobacteriota bacterium]MBV9478317.1 hypothetical protein [Acidobacteriota bacterium]